MRPPIWGQVLRRYLNGRVEAENTGSRDYLQWKWEQCSSGTLPARGEPIGVSIIKANDFSGKHGRRTFPSSTLQNSRTPTLIHTMISWLPISERLRSFTRSCLIHRSRKKKKVTLCYLAADTFNVPDTETSKEVYLFCNCTHCPSPLALSYHLWQL